MILLGATPGLECGCLPDFDDRPDPRATPEVLEVLGGLDVRATFFVLGSLARSHPRLVEEMMAAGHRVNSMGMSTSGTTG